jgi:hypothetical protein
LTILPSLKLNSAFSVFPPSDLLSEILCKAIVTSLDPCPFPSSVSTYSPTFSIFTLESLP